jgi:hypothetical protein
MLASWPDKRRLNNNNSSKKRKKKEELGMGNLDINKDCTIVRK